MEKDALILLATGSDRPGIVDRISGVIYEEGCNLEDSRMSILGGEFALIVLVTGHAGCMKRLEGQFETLAREMDLALQVKRTPRPETASEPRQTIPYLLNAVAMDHPGIVHKISRLLNRIGINVARLDTRLSHAPLTGTPIFSLELEAQVPTDVPVVKLRAELASLAEAENIDIELHPAE